MRDNTLLRQNPVSLLLSRPKLIGFLLTALSLFLESVRKSPLQSAPS